MVMPNDITSIVLLFLAAVVLAIWMRVQVLSPTDSEALPAPTMSRIQGQWRYEARVMEFGYEPFFSP
jgi:hypothetical protein